MATVASSAVTTFNEWKIRGGASFLKFQLRNGEIAITETGPKEKPSWNSFVQDYLPNDEPCWVVIGFSYQTKDGAKRNKTTLIQWVPSLANRRDKMQYALWSNTLKASLVGVHCRIQAGGLDEVDYDTVLDKVSKFEREEM